MNAKHIEVTRAAAKVMREKPLSRPETVSGRVIELHSDNPLDLLSPNSGSTIVVMWNSEDLGEIPVLYLFLQLTISPRSTPIKPDVP